ncbi:hypothetical protein [Flavobacterium taihuense]|uniref:Uncharacterized protein n=1 Tax=Flavobacterium taihuense TaxID=2857508 RepID=A0ABS6Y0P3_9FLAO|nr:hypothetical protein [Flavobacterium taihuense]MBW4362116.1 hypothetical protein [Flavobacterium taihuense]
MTNVTKNNKANNVQLHIEKAYEIIDNYLPVNYVEAVLAKLPKNTNITKGMIRNAKKKLSKRIDVINAMVEVALENKALVEELKRLTT